MRWPFRRRAEDSVAREVREEIDAHLEMRTEEGLRNGLTLAEARRAAEARLGALPPIVLESSRIRRRASRTGRAVMADASQAIKSLVRSPGGAIAGVLVTAIGLSTALAAAVVGDALLVRPPTAVHQPAQLYSALDSFREGQPSLLSFRAAEAIARAAPDLAFFAWGTRDLQVRHRGDGALMNAALVTARYFEILRTRPATGRLLGPRDAAAASHVAVLSARAARRLAVDRGLPDSAILINGRPFEVVGIAESGFFGLDGTAPIDIWLPVEAEPAVSKARVFPDGRIVRGFIGADIGWMFGGIRLTHPAEAGEIRSRLTAILRSQNTRDVPERQAIVQPRIWLSPFSRNREQLEAIAKPLAGLGLLTLLLTATCVGSLFVARVSGRQRELGVRLALGSSRVRLLRLCGIEMALVLAVGALFGLVGFAALLASLGSLHLLPGVSLADAVKGIDLRAVMIMTAMAATVSALAAAGPLAFVLRLRTMAPDLARISAPAGRLRTVLMTAQVAAGCGLLTGAFLLTQSVWALRGQPLGYDARNVSFAELDPGSAGLDDAERVALAMRALRHAPAALRVAIADDVPFSGDSTLTLQGEGAADLRAIATPATRIAGPYFELLNVPLVAGRRFEPSDAVRAVVILSRPLADAWWPRQPAIGRVIRVGGAKGKPYEVIGVVEGLRDRTLRRGPGARVYLPFTAETERLTVVATTHDGQAEQELRDFVQRLDPRIAPGRSGRLEQLVLRSIEQRLLLRAFTSVVGLGSLALVLVGVWGLSHSNVLRRWRELGIRQALGAPAHATVLTVYRDALVIAIAGSIAGIFVGAQFGQLMASMLFGVEPRSVPTLAAAAIVVAMAALIGAILPARKALRLDPSMLLRSM